MKTKAPYRTTYNNEVIEIPAGTPVSHETATGPDKNYHFVNKFDWYKPELKGFARQMAIHDMAHRGINIPVQLIDKN